LCRAESTSWLAPRTPIRAKHTGDWPRGGGDGWTRRARAGIPGELGRVGRLRGSKERGGDGVEEPVDHKQGATSNHAVTTRCILLQHLRCSVEFYSLRTATVELLHHRSRGSTTSKPPRGVATLCVEMDGTGGCLSTTRACCPARPRYRAARRLYDVVLHEVKGIPPWVSRLT